MLWIIITKLFNLFFGTIPTLLFGKLWDRLTKQFNRFWRWVRFFYFPVIWSYYEFADVEGDDHECRIVGFTAHGLTRKKKTLSHISAYVHFPKTKDTFPVMLRDYDCPLDDEHVMHIKPNSHFVVIARFTDETDRRKKFHGYSPSEYFKKFGDEFVFITEWEKRKYRKRVGKTMIETSIDEHREQHQRSRGIVIRKVADLKEGNSK